MASKWLLVLGGASSLVFALLSACSSSPPAASDAATRDVSQAAPLNSANGGPPSSGRHHPLSQGELADFQRGCQRDADCSRLSNGCCGCEGSGEDVGILRDKVAAFRARFTCHDVPCPTMYNPVCERLHAVCRAGRCEVTGG